VATFALLLAGGIVVLLFATRLTAAAFHYSFTPFRYLGIPAGHDARALLLLAAVVALLVLVWLVLREGQDMLWLQAAGGGVLVSTAAVERTVEAAARSNPEVVRAEASLRLRGGRVAGSVRLYGRPLGDAARLAAAVEPVVQARLLAVSGAEPGRVVVRPRILTVPQLKRYLP